MKKYTPNMNFYDSQANQALKNNIPQIINNNKHDHLIYYITITFKFPNEPILEDAYKNFFYRLHAVIKNNSTVASKDKSRRPKLLLTPEKSIQLINGRLTPHHYHGFVMIPLSRQHQWEKKAVMGHYCDLKWRKDCIVLKKKFYDISIDGLQIESIMSFNIQNQSDIEQISAYNLKNYNYSGFKYDDAILLT